MLTLYPKPLLSSFNISRKFFCKLFQIFYRNYHVICNQRQFYLFLPMLCIYCFLYLPHYLDKTYSMMLKKNGERRHPGFFLYLSEKNSTFLSLRIMLFVNFKKYSLSIWGHFSPFLVSITFYYQWVLDNVKCFFRTYEI